MLIWHTVRSDIWLEYDSSKLDITQHSLFPVKIKADIGQDKNVPVNATNLKMENIVRYIGRPQHTNIYTQKRKFCHYSTSCRFKPVRTQIKIFLMESDSSQTLLRQQGSIHNQGPET